MLHVCRLSPALLLVLTAGVVHAQSVVPSLVGTWVTVSGKGVAAHWSGNLSSDVNNVGTLVVEEQLEGAFHGTMTWEIDKTQPQYEGKAGLEHSLSETVVGIIDWDNVSVFWADHEDETVYRARLVDENTMEVVVLEAGPHAAAGRAIMTRQ